MAQSRLASASALGRLRAVPARLVRRLSDRLGWVPLSATLAGALLSACAPVGSGLVSQSPAWRVSVTNLDGPTVRLLIGARQVATLNCGDEVDLNPARTGLPLPWHIAFVRTDGSSVGSVDETESEFWPYIVIRYDGVVAGDAPGIGPVPRACP